MNISGQKPKIALVVTQGVWGGAQQYVHDLAKAFQNDYEVVVISGSGEELRSRLAQARIRHIRAKSLVRGINPFQELKALFELVRIFRAEKPDIVHLNSSKAGVLGAVASKLAGNSKVVFTVHGLVLNEPLPFYKKSIFWAAEKFASFFRDATITVSELDHRSVIRFRLANSKNTFTVHNGLDQEDLNSLNPMKAREQLAKLTHGNITDKTPLVGTIADFYSTKGYPNLIAAAAIVCNQRPDVRFLAFGRGNADKEKKLIESSGLQKKFFLILGDNNAASYLSGLNVFVLASNKEGLPYTVLQAMLSGTPIAATNVGGIPELVKDQESALLCGPHDPNSLAQNISNILNSPNFGSQLAQNAKLEAQKYTKARMSEATKKVYQMLLVN